MHIGPYELKNRVFLAPMAGVTDWPFRQLCSEQGAGLVVSEMMSSNPDLWHTPKSLCRATHHDEVTPRSVQIAGGCATMMAEAAQYNVDLGAQIIDINMGCPAKKVCKLDAGSALLKNESLVADILSAVVAAVSVPVTLKIRTGWSADTRNALSIARIAEDCGIAALTIHGRTREQRFQGEAEYDTIRQVKQAVKIPIIANGDINDEKKAKMVLEYTGADAIMLGRAAQGRPWIFQEIEHYLKTGELLASPSLTMIKSIMLRHLENLYSLYGEYRGVRIARKHIGWYLETGSDTSEQKALFNRIETAAEQLKNVQNL